MDARLIDRIESGIGPGAAALFGGAVAYAAFLVLRGIFEPALAYAAAAGAIGFFGCRRAMATVERVENGFRLPSFTLDEIEPVELDELQLTDADRFTPVQPIEPEPLVLDDILAEIGPDSRVVRLFDRKAMPTPGQLKSRIDGHMRNGVVLSPVPDASQQLSEALAELRRSLR
jgi:hypothetical protein